MNELPIVIAPDGNVIQLTFVSRPDEDGEEGTVCDQCHMTGACIKAEDMAKILGEDCTDYDDDAGADKMAVWQVTGDNE